MLKTAYIFDMDGVLVDSEAFYFELRMQFLREHHLPNYYPDINAYLGVDPAVEWQMMIPDAAVRQQLSADFERFWAQHPIDYAACILPQVPELLLDLKQAGCRIALASVGALTEVEQMLTQCQLPVTFDVVLSAADVQQKKPAPDVYLAAIHQLKLTSRQCVAIEDSTVGIMAAKRAGLETWAIADPRYHVDQSQADRVFTGIGAVRDFIKKQQTN